MSWQFRVSIFRLPALAGVFALMLLAMLARSVFAAGNAGARIVIVGTDDQLYVCSGECTKSECITCPVKGLQVRAWSEIRRVSMNAQFEPPIMPPWEESPKRPVVPMRYGWPTFSPDGSKLAYSWDRPQRRRQPIRHFGFRFRPAFLDSDFCQPSGADSMCFNENGRCSHVTDHSVGG